MFQSIQIEKNELQYYCSMYLETIRKVGAAASIVYGYRDHHILLMTRADDESMISIVNSIITQSGISF